MSKEKENFEWTGETFTHQDIKREKLARLEKKLTIDPDNPNKPIVPKVNLPRLITILYKIHNIQ